MLDYVQSEQRFEPDKTQVVILKRALQESKRRQARKADLESVPFGLHLFSLRTIPCDSMVDVRQLQLRQDFTRQSAKRKVLLV